MNDVNIYDHFYEIFAVLLFNIHARRLFAYAIYDDDEDITAIFCESSSAMANIKVVESSLNKNEMKNSISIQLMMRTTIFMCVYCWKNL